MIYKVNSIKNPFTCRNMRMTANNNQAITLYP